MQAAFLRPLSRRASMLVLGCCTAVVLLGIGGRAAYRKLSGKPKSAAQVRNMIWEHLEEQAGTDEFKANLPATTNPVPLTVTVTNAAGRIKVKQRKRAPLDPQIELSRQFQSEVAAATDYKGIYRLIGGHLRTAEKQLEATEAAQKEAGLLTAMEASRAAQHDAGDVWLSARICEGYLWPNLEVAANASNRRLRADTVLDVAERSFRLAEETDCLTRHYQIAIRTAVDSKRADAARLRLARLLEQQQDFAGALKYLREIRGTNKPALAERVAQLEQLVQARR